MVNLNTVQNSLRLTCYKDKYRHKVAILCSTAIHKFHIQSDPCMPECILHVLSFLLIVLHVFCGFPIEFSVKQHVYFISLVSFLELHWI